MKLKLKVSKDTKRALKLKAIEHKMSRTDYVLYNLQEHIKAHKAVWDGKIDAYRSKYEKRAKLLENLLIEQRKDKETPHSEKVDALRAFYDKHQIYMHIQSKNAQQENIIIRVTEDAFYALQMLADEDKMSMENYVSKILQYFK